MTLTSPSFEITSYVGGTWIPGTSDTSDINPADPAEVVAKVSLATTSVAVAGVEAAHKAFPAWRAAGSVARGAVLRKAADLLEDRAETIGRDLSREEGKTLAEGVRETRLAADVFRYYAGQTLDADGETYPSRQADVLLFTRREPLGVVSVITPWNFPIAIPAWKIAPALAFGNAVVWKPADLVPLTAVHLVRVLTEAGIPDGVLNLVVGRGADVGEVLTTHELINAVTFTGSTAVGRIIAGRAVGSGKKIQLELGGKNPAVVLADAELDLAADQISNAAFGGTGQKCTATSRVIVERPVLSALVERLKERAEGWRLGDPLDPATSLGPVASAGQLTSVLGYLDRAQADGARFVAGEPGRASGSLGDGFFVRPALLTGLGPNHPTASEEVFGPVAAVLPADSYDEAVTLANDTPYGLSASVFTSDLSKAMRFTRDIHAGIVKVNQGTSGVEFQVPFGGMKDSGYGQREQGKAAREFFTESKTVYVNFG